MLKFILLSALPLLAVAIAPKNTKPGVSSNETAKANDYVDDIIEALLKDDSDLDPHHLYTEVITHHDGHFSELRLTLSHGIISGFEAIHRSKSCSVVKECTKYHASASLSIAKMYISYSASVESESFRINFHANGTFTGIDTEMQFSFEKDDVSFERFTLSDDSKLKVEISEESKLECIMSAKTVKELKDKISKAMSKDLRMFIDNAAAADMRMKIAQLY